MKEKLVVIAGPTATGKSDLAIELALRKKGEIISADSMQVYRGMDIGTAKLRPEEMKGIPHHLIDVLDPSESFNVALFHAMAKEAVSGICAKGHLPIVAGGTGFYIQALLYDIPFAEEDNTQIRKKLEEEAALQPEKLYERLCLTDPDYAKTLHPNNVKKVIRALEYMELNGGTFSAHNAEERERTSPYDFSYFVLTDDRARLYEGIEKRVDRMMEEGLLEEVRSLRDRGCDRSMISMQGLGYKEILDHLDGKCSLQEAVDKIKKETRHFAKRQLTWFKREKEVIWVDKREFDYDRDAILSYLIERAGL